MPCKREARYRHNTIAFWLSDEEKRMVEARIILSGLPKGEYYRRSVLGQKVTVCGDRYHSAKLAMTLERIYADSLEQESGAKDQLLVILEELLELWKKQE